MNDDISFSASGWHAWLLNALEDAGEEWTTYSPLKLWEVACILLAVPLILVEGQFRMEGHVLFGFYLWCCGIIFMTVVVRRARFSLWYWVRRGDEWLERTKVPHRLLYLCMAACSSFTALVGVIIFSLADTLFIKTTFLILAFITMRMFLFFVGCAAKAQQR